MRPRWRKVLRDLSSHKFRAMLVVLSIAIGIFAVGVMMGGREVLLREFRSDHAASAPANVTYWAADFGDDLVRRAADQPEVAAAQGRRSTRLRYTWPGAEGERTIAIESFQDFDDLAVAKVIPLGNGHWPPRAGEIVLEAAAKQVGDYAVGDILSVERADGEVVELRIAGFAHDINAVPAPFVGYETGYVAFDALGDLGEPERYNQLSLVFAEQDISWVGSSNLATDLRERLFDARGIAVLYTDVPEPGSHFLGDIFDALSLLLLVLGALALGLSAFLVVNTVSSLMTQQVRQVGIMKAVGGSALQLEWLYVVTVTLYGVAATAIGVPLTAAGTRWLIDFAAGILNFRVTSYAPPAWVIVVEFAVGMAVPLLAAAGPIRKGTRMSVVRALNATGMTGGRFGQGLVDRVLGMIRGLPRPVALSLRNTFLRKGRLALTLSTLVLASAVVMAVWSVQASINQTIADLETWWNYNVQIDLALPQDDGELTAAIEDVDGAIASETLTVFGATLVRDDASESESFRIVGLDPETDFVGPRLMEGRWLKPDDTGAIVINTDTQNAEPSLGVGSTVRFDVLGTETTWRVVGVIKGQLGGASVYCNEAELAHRLGDPGATRVVVRGIASDADSERALLVGLEDALDDAGYPIASATTRAELSNQLSEWLGLLVAFLVLMATLLAAVGVIGLTGTMSINVLESTREIGVMRACGAQHASIYQIYVAEGATVGALSWFFGALLAYPMSLGLVVALEGAMGVPLSFTFSWSGVFTWLAMMLVIAGGASIAPAFRASQVSVRDAISYE